MLNEQISRQSADPIPNSSPGVSQIPRALSHLLYSGCKIVQAAIKNLYQFKICVDALNESSVTTAARSAAGARALSLALKPCFALFVFELAQTPFP